jgi:hypothetical protein
MASWPQSLAGAFPEPGPARPAMTASSKTKALL